MEKVTKETKLSKLLQDPEIEKILKKNSFPCVACPFAKMEMENLKLGEVCLMYGLDAEKTIKEINSLYKK